MLAVRLHTHENPSLSEGVYLIPILKWDIGKIIIKRWISELNRGKGKRVTKIRYISLVKIPDDHLVFFALGASNKTFAQPTFKPLSAIPQETKREFALWFERFATMASKEGTLNLPELVIGERLDDKCIIWTKRVQLLYGREANVKNRKHSGR